MGEKPAHQYLNSRRQQPGLHSKRKIPCSIRMEQGRAWVS